MTIQQAFELATQHHQAGRLRDAESICRQILAVEPRHADALHVLGVIAHQVGRSDIAVDFIRQAIAVTPCVPHFHSNLGEACRALGRLDEAIAALEQAIVLQPELSQAHSNLSVALWEKGQMNEAIVASMQAIALNPNLPGAHNSLGNALKSTGQMDEAIAAYRQAIALNPNYAEAYSNLGNVLTEKRQPDEAIAAYRQSIALRPNSPEALSNLGNALRAKGQLHEAIALCRRAIALQPQFHEAHLNLGIALYENGQLDEAIAVYRQAVALRPDVPETHNNLSLILLLQGHFIEGWEEHEWRWKMKDFPSPQRNFAQPQWDGGPLEERTLLLHAEQGFGDTLQFIRYLPLVKGRATQIVVECQPEFLRLFQAMASNLQVVAKGNSLPPFDVHCPLLSLPGAFATDLTNIPASIPYLRADAADAAMWRERLAGDSAPLKVGLVWAGSSAHTNDRYRSLTLDALGPLAEVPDVRFYSLQKSAAVADTPAPPRGMEWFDFTGELKDFADTAALIANLDLVIAVDTAVAHLAGAMGKPVWTLLPFAPDWRWLLGREDSPWYPTMRLFRQPAAGDWDSVLTRVREKLQHLVQFGRETTAAIPQQVQPTKR